MANTLETLFEKYKYDSSIAAKSKTWFQQQQLLLAKKTIDPKRLMREGQTARKITPGKLYMFFYDPKLKDTLPYYDRFPLVFPYAKTQDGFIGLNMHYLPYYHRVQLMSRLMSFTSNENMDENTRLRYSWNLIKGVSRFKLAEACIKQYLSDNVVSQLVEIPASDWHTAMMLPVERFTKSNKGSVWKDSIKV